ncbi:MAG: hypothetical protein AAF126_01480 [Chloroflexota bacterium]
MNADITHYVSDYTPHKKPKAMSLVVLPRADVDTPEQRAVKRTVRAIQAILADLQRDVGITLASDVDKAIYSVSAPTVEDYFTSMSAPDDERTLTDGWLGQAG